MKKFLVLMVIMCIILTPFCMATMPNGVDVVNYDDATNYMSLMISAAEDGSPYALHMGAIYEAQRNMKIVTQGVDSEPTDVFTEYRSPDEIRVMLASYITPTAMDETTYYTEEDVTMIAKTIYNEARGISNKVELACIAWTILNRVDAGQGSIEEVIVAPHQFAYSYRAPTVNDHGIDLTELSRDVLDRWSREKNGEVNVGRVLPLEYRFYGGNGRSNSFRIQYNPKTATYWDYSLPNPYES